MTCPLEFEDVIFILGDIYEKPRRSPSMFLKVDLSSKIENIEMDL